MNPHWPYRLTAVPQLPHVRTEIAKAVHTLAVPNQDELCGRQAKIPSQQRYAEDMINAIRAAARECATAALLLMRKYRF